MSHCGAPWRNQSGAQDANATQSQTWSWQVLLVQDMQALQPLCSASTVGCHCLFALLLVCCLCFEPIHPAGWIIASVGDSQAAMSSSNGAVASWSSKYAPSGAVYGTYLHVRSALCDTTNSLAGSQATPYVQLGSADQPIKDASRSM